MATKPKQPKRKPRKPSDRALRERLVMACWNPEANVEINMEHLRAAMHWIETGCILGKPELEVVAGGRAS